MLTEKDFQEKYNNLLHRDGLLSSRNISRFRDHKGGQLAKLGSEASNGIARSFSKSHKSTDDILKHMMMLDDVEARAHEIIGNSSSPEYYSPVSSGSSQGSSTEENILVSIILFPIRLPILIIKIVFQIISSIVSFLFSLGFALVVTVIGVPLMFLALGICIFVFIPIRVFVWIVTFGRRIFLEDELFDWPASVLYWILDSWDL